MSGHSKWHNIQAKKGKADAARGVIVKIAAAVIAAASIFLAVQYFKTGGEFFGVHYEWINYLMMGIEACLAIYIIYIGVKHKKWLASLFALIQTPLLIWFELTDGHHIAVQNNMYVDRLSIIMILIIGIVGTVVGMVLAAIRNLGIRDLRFAYYQANVALDLAFRLRSEKWIIAFSECAMEHVLEKIDLPLWTMVSPELLSMIEYDRQKDTQYFETFREYLLNERDIPKTSEKLIIHRTPLLYRLKKIQSQWNLNLEDPWQRLYLTWSLWMLEKEESLKKK